MPKHWAANMRNPVRFHQAITAAGANHATFIEISPHPMLTHAITETLGEEGHHHSVGTLRREADDTITFHTNLNTTHTMQPATDPAPARTPPNNPHHPLAPHPPLDQHHAHHASERIC